MARIRLVLGSILLISSGVAAASGWDLTNNLFSDLAPLLTLFGERFAQQFLSESFTWLDHIVFAMAPLGIITALVSAIRVGGPKWLKALVGRARENIAAAEVELMSSTSHEVCELYNGKALVRSVGRPVVKQLVYLKGLKDEGEFGLFSLETPTKHLSECDPQSPRAVLASNAKDVIHKVRHCDIDKLRMPKQESNSCSDSAFAERGPAPESNGLLPTANEPPSSASKTRPGKSRTEPEHAPNISLNLHGGSNVVELACYALVGVLLQAGVLVFSGFAAYHPGLKKKLEGLKANIGFPLQAVGTILLVLGMVLCSLVIERSTKEKRWITKGNDGVRILWLQKGNVVSDQSFESYLLMARRERREILTSRRNILTDAEDKSGQSGPEDKERSKDKKRTRDNKAVRTYLNLLTVLGVVCGIVGFIAQFAGFRLSNWSNTIAQLVAVFLMTVLRAVVRRGLTENPATEKLDEKYEMDWLALQIAEDDKFLDDFSDPEKPTKPIPTWEVVTPKPEVNTAAREVTTPNEETTTTPGGHTPDQGGTTPSNVNLALRWKAVTQTIGEEQKAVRIRRRLGQLTGWVGVASEQAVAVANATEVVMNTLFPTGFGTESAQQSFFWRLGVNCGEGKREIEFTVKREKLWSTDSTKIEAVLSLWNYHFWRKYLDPMVQRESDQHSLTDGKELDHPDWLRSSKSIIARQCRRVLGPKTDALYQDLAWWISDGVAQESQTEYKEQNTQDILRWGFSGLEPESKDLESNDRGVLEINTAWENSLAQHIFSAFMWAIAEKVPREIFSSTTVDPRAFNIDDEKTWTSPKLQNAKLLEMAREIQSTRIGTLEEVYLSIIPPLSFTSKLPDEAIVELVRERALDYETNCRWERAYEVYLRLLELSQKRSSTDRFVHKAVAAAIEFLIQATTEPLTKDRDASYKRVKNQETIKGDLVKMLKGRDLQRVTVCLRALYVKQSRGEQYDSLFEDQNMRVGNESFAENYEYNQQTDVLGWTKWRYNILEAGNSASKVSEPVNLSILDITGRTPLHYAVIKGTRDLVDLLLNEGADVNLRGRDGMLPLHWAAKLGHTDVAESLLNRDAKRDASDNAGRTALHLAAGGGHKAVAKLLVATEKVDVNSKDNNGRTPLSWAAGNGHEAVVRLLVEKGADVNAKGHYGWTALPWAAVNGHEAVVRLLVEKGADVNAKGHDGWTALRSAAVNGHEAVVRLLTPLTSHS